MPEYQMKF